MYHSSATLSQSCRWIFYFLFTHLMLSPFTFRSCPAFISLYTYYKNPSLHLHQLSDCLQRLCIEILTPACFISAQPALVNIRNHTDHRGIKELLNNLILITVTMPVTSPVFVLKTRETQLPA